MSDLNYTPAQREAIETRGCPILVSAAAGSGKTRVLTQRLISRVLEGEDINRFLVITFTRAAAAELRGRILTELNALAAADPGDRRLRRQSALLYRAQIGTIDSFCTSVVRENAHLLGISPGFSVLDEEHAGALRSRALEEVLDSAYENIERDDGLRALVDSAGAGRDDARLGELVLSLHAQLQSRPWPEKWAEEKLSMLDVSGLTDAGQTVWGRYLLDDAAEEADFRARELEDALAFLTQPGNEPLMKGYGQSFSDAAAFFRGVSRASREGWDRTAAALAVGYPRLGAARGVTDEAARAKVKSVWDGSREAVKKLQKNLAGDSASLLAGIRRSRPALRSLMALVSALDRQYAARKRRADACDFSDLEHFCLRLLCGPEADEPSPLAHTLSARFAEVMVDEYQDVNAVQELIFRRVSGEGERLFMVGDVKQSIYRFRLAEPSIFNGKYAAFEKDEHARRVLLRENFRSRGAVLNACNAVFSRIMSPSLGEIDYNDEARLVRGADYPAAGEILPELCVIDTDASGGDGTPSAAAAEARYVAARIKAMVDSGEPVSDGRGGTRPMEYGDVAVLLRTPGTSGAAYRRALAEAGVPVSARQGGAFFSQPEVSFAVSMLAAADNPRQDVPLIAALRGLPFGFTPDELTAIRAAAGGDFWDALRLRAETDGRCARFVSVLEELRELARDEPTESVLRWLYDRTGLMAACAVMPDALQRTANLMQLYEYARRFEQDGNRGLFRFTAWLRRLEEKGLEPPTAAADGSVQIMSVHKSKGLEFPVVFLADNSHRWNRGGTGQALCHSELGLGMRITDMEKGVDYPTLPWRAIEQKTKMEELSEQERVLYVAMTRARERLIMTCVQPGAAEKLAAMGPPSDGALSPRVLAGAQNIAQWLMRAAAADGGRTIKLRVIAPETEKTAPPPEKPRAAAAPEDIRALAERLSWTYPYAEAVTVPSKLTATEIKRLEDEADPEAALLPGAEGEGPRPFRKPELSREDAPLTGAERGVAAHLVMQHIDLRETGSAEAIAAEIERLERLGFLDRRQAEAVPPEDILAFFRSDIGRRLLRAGHVMREFRFSLLCPARQWFPAAPEGEEILLQGVVDCCIEEADGLTVIDFKTDARVEPERHTAQIAAYAAAMERITGKPVRGAVLWYLRRKQAVEMPLPSGRENMGRHDK